MKIYTIEIDMTNVLGMLRRFRLGEFNSQYPILFIESNDPDEACYFTYCKLSEILLKQNESIETAKLIGIVHDDLRIKKVYCKDEKRL
jgi:hypothetical protein